MRYDCGVSPSLKSLQENLRRLRRERGLTQESLAEKAGMTYRHVQQIEAGARPGLQVATIDRLAVALQVTAASLISPEAGEEARGRKRS